MIKCIYGLALTLLLTAPLLAQSDDEVLFSVGDKDVTVGEFRYIYSKTNGDDADFSRESVMEYLDLYERFKLKVARAHAMGLDTVVALQNELEGYRKQLADNYLVDREVTDKLVEELYAHQQQDVDFSHLLVKIDEGDTLSAYRRATEIKQRLTSENFAQVASQESDDTYSKQQGGRIGFVAAPLPRGLHRLERALYDAPTDRVMGPVRTSAGYHLFVKHATRPAYGEVEVAHIIIRKPEEEGADAGAMQARQQAEQALREINDGASFEEVAARYSEDDKSKQQGGYIGFFGINRYNKVFEEAAFALSEDGEVSEVIESPVGFHILKRISRRGVQPLDEQRPLLEAAVKQDDRFAEGRQAMIERLAQEYGTQRMEDNLARYAEQLDESFFDMNKQFTATADALTLLTIGDRALTTADFEDYLERNTRLRASLVRRYDAPEAARELYDRWADEQVENYAEAQLEKQFPEFGALMREYREGILLFEATRMEVWDKASEDTTGLKVYFSNHREDYTFGPRARVLKIEVASDESPSLLEVLDYAKDHDTEGVLDHFGRQSLSITEELYEEDRLPDGLTMSAGSHTDPATGAGNTVYLIKEIQPTRRKELDEARGYIIADYQDQLEREWVEELRKQYEVKVNKKVLNKLIQS